MKRIAIHGVPRSGTTWVGALFDSCPKLRYVTQPLFSYAFKGKLDLDSTRQDIVRFFAEIAASDDEFINQTPQKATGAIPDFEKNEVEAIAYKEARYHHLIPHLLAADEELFVFLIIRNPLSVLASWKLAPKEFDRETMDFLAEWQLAQSKNGNRQEEFYGFKKWIEFSLMAHEMIERYPSRCKIIEYRKLLENTTDELKSCFAFCGLPFSQQSVDFIENSERHDQKADPYSVFRFNQDDDKWRKVLPATVVDEIANELADTQLERYL